MRSNLLVFVFGILLLISCNNEDVSLFDKDADTRSAEATAALKEKLAAPANGWLLKYRPESESGSYNVILKFDTENNVNIKSDLGVNDGEFFDQTITYRIDNSLGLELIFENYSFFSYLFEQDQASFGAEFEFNYVNETEAGDLVFNSKSDVGQPTVIAFQQAAPGDVNLLGTAISGNISKMTEGVPTLTSVLKMSYTQKDVALYFSLDDFRRILSFNFISKNSTTQNGQKIKFSSGYTIDGNTIILDNALTGSFMGNTVSVSAIRLNDFSSTVTTLCADTVTLYKYTGTLDSNESVVLETSLLDPEGTDFDQLYTFFNAPIRNILKKDKSSAQDEVAADIIGVSDMQLYFTETQNGPLNALGFRIENPNASVTFALREFDYTIENNVIKFDFAPDYTLFGDTTVTVDTAAMNKYLDLFAENDNTHVYRYSETLFEFYNPCNGWGFYFFVNQN